MKRKIHYVLTVADAFVKDSLYPMDVPVGEQTTFSDLVIEYEQVDKDPLADAEIALKAYIRKKYPGKDYRTYYWTLEFI